MSREFAGELGHVIRREEDSKAQLTGNGRRSRRKPMVPKGLIDYMEAVVKNPFVTATERDALLGLTAYMGNQRRKELNDREMARLHRVSLGRRGKNIVLVELLPQAYGVLRQHDVTANPPRGIGSFIHRFRQHSVAAFMESTYGARCVIEDSSTGKSVDVSAELDGLGGKRVAIEICISNSGGNAIDKEIRNIWRDQGYDEVWVTAENEETLGRIRAKAHVELEEEEITKVRWKLLSELTL